MMIAPLPPIPDWSSIPEAEKPQRYAMYARELQDWKDRELGTPMLLNLSLALMVPAAAVIGTLIFIFGMLPKLIVGLR